VSLTTPFRLAVFALLGAAPALADGPYFTAALAETWQSNVNNAPPPDVTRSAWTSQVAGQAQWLTSLDFGTLLTAGLKATADDCTTFHGLDSAGLDGSIALRRKFGLGAFAPYVSLGAEGAVSAFDDSERSFGSVALALNAGKRLTDFLQVEASAHAGWLDARSQVFSGSWVDAGLSLNWDVTETWRLKLLGGWRNGDIVTTYAAYGSPGAWLPDDPGAYAYAKPWKYVGTYGAPYLAYRLRGRTLSGGVALAPALSAATTLQVQFLRCETQGYDLYFNNVVTASITHVF
jgi:hypothetical protein